MIAMLSISMACNTITKTYADYIQVLKWYLTLPQTEKR